MKPARPSKSARRRTYYNNLIKRCPADHAVCRYCCTILPLSIFNYRGKETHCWCQPCAEIIRDGERRRREERRALTGKGVLPSSRSYLAARRKEYLASFPGLSRILFWAAKEEHRLQRTHGALHPIEGFRVSSSLEGCDHCGKKPYKNYLRFWPDYSKPVECLYLCPPCSHLAHMHDARTDARKRAQIKKGAAWLDKLGKERDRVARAKRRKKDPAGE